MESNLTRNPLFRFLTVVLLPLLVLLLVVFRLNGYYQIVFVLFFVNVVLAAALNLTNGITGIFSLGAAGFMGLGAYISTLLSLPPELKTVRIPGIPEWLASIQLPFPVSLLLAGLLTMAFAAVVGYPILKARGHYLAVITLGMVIMLKTLMDNVTTLTNGAKGISGMEKYTTLPVAVAAALVTLYVLYRIKASPLGRSMIALRDDEDAAASLGVSATTIRMFSFLVSAFFCAVGGCLWAHLERSIAPSMFYFDETFSILEMSVLGGMATLSGAIPGAAILTFVPQVLANFETGFTFFGLQVPKINGFSAMVMSVLFILVIIFRKGGVVRDSEYIVESLFSRETYTGLFRAETYRSFIQSIRQLFKQKTRRKQNESI